MKVLIFGTGDIAGKIFQETKRKYEIIGFIDNSLKKQNTYYDKEQTYYIYSPNEIHKLIFSKVIIASTNYASEMFSQLLSLGVREHDIIVDYVCKSQKVYLYDFMKMQIGRNGNFNRMDIAVKYMAVDSYIHQNRVGIELYISMQKKRLGLTDEEATQQWNKFKILIDSIESQGYDNDYSIICDEKMRVMDGAHRIALCLYFNINRIPIKVTPQKFECEYGIEWFWEKGFARKTIQEIEKVKESFCSAETEEIIAFVWPPAMECIDEIKKDLSCLTIIKDSKTKVFKTDDDFQHFVRAIYIVDDIEMWKVEKKLEHMCGYDKQVEILTLQMKQPEYRLKASSGLPLAANVEKIKKIIRTRYKDKISNYYYDNIIHIADNYYQSKLIQKIMVLDYDISKCFDSIKNEKYALTKIDVPYMPKDFPEKYPVHKDADILCIANCFAIVADCLRKFAQKYTKQYGLELREIQEKKKVRIRMEYLDFLIYQFDVSKCIEEVEADFIDNAIVKRNKCKNFYTLSEEDEIIIREYELKIQPEKKHHVQYLKNKE